MEMGIPLDEIRRMPWGRLVLMLQARARQYENENSGVRDATMEEIMAWI